MNAISSNTPDMLRGAQAGDTPASLAKQAFSNCFYCGMISGIWAGADQVAVNIAANLASTVKNLAISLFGLWLMWQLLLAVVPFGADDQAFGRSVRGAGLVALSIIILNSYGAGPNGSVAGRLVYRPIITVTTETTAAIMGGINQGLGMPNLGFGTDAGCTMSAGDVGGSVACASWQSARYAIAGLTIGYAMSTTSLTTSDALSFLVPYVVSVIFGVILFVAWTVVLLAFPISAASYILRVSVIFAFSPLMVVAIPYPSARGVVGKAIRSLIGAGVQLWGLAVVAAGAGACVAFAIQAAAKGDVFSFITAIGEGNQRIYPYQPAYLVLLAGAVLTLAAMISVHRQIAEFLSDTSVPAAQILQQATHKARNALGVKHGAAVSYLKDQGSAHVAAMKKQFGA